MTNPATAFENPLKHALRAGEPIVGFNVFECLRPSVARVLAQTGYDFVLVETEHIMHSPESVTSFLTLARDLGLMPIVTIPSVSRAFVSRHLDAGAMGLCLCHSESADDVEELARYMKYPPAGERALAHGPNAGYAMPDAARYCREANEATFLALKIESHKGVTNAQAMLDHPAVDAVVFGPGDLAADMGLHGQWQHLDVIGAMEGVIELALARGLAVEPVVGPSSPEAFAREVARGIRIFGPTRASEYDALRIAAEQLIAPFR